MTGAAQRGTSAVSERAVRMIAERTAGETLPVPPAETVGHVQRHVVERTRQLTGLDVPAARLTVTALTPSPSPRPPASPPRADRRSPCSPPPPP